jgi:hypothetical protein
MFIANQIFELLTQPSSIALAIAIVRRLIVMTKDDNDTQREISENESEDLEESTLSFDIEEDNLENQQEVLQVDQACRDKTIRTTSDPPPKNQSRADTVIARTSLPNLRPPAGAMAPPLLKQPKSAINISRESDIVQAIPLPKAGGD